MCWSLNERTKCSGRSDIIDGSLMKNAAFLLCGLIAPCMSSISVMDDPDIQPYFDIRSADRCSLFGIQPYLEKRKENLRCLL